MSAGKSRIPVREMVFLALMAALMTAGQVSMAALPNIEPVSLLVLVGAVVFGWKILFSVYAFVLVEGFIYGFGMWFVNYLYVWTVLAVVAILLRKCEGRLVWAAVSGFFGLAFGFLCAIPYVVTRGIPGAVAYYISGIPFDLLHAAGNFVMALLLFPPCVSILRKLKNGAVTS